MDILVLTEGQKAKAISLEATAIVLDGMLTIEFVRGTANPLLNALEISYLEPHVAHAVTNGPYSAVDTDGDGFAVVAVDGTLSHTHGLGLHLLTWEWIFRSHVIGNGEKTSLRLPAGKNVVTLHVKDDGGYENSASTVITVNSENFPSVLSLEPATGAVTGGDFVTIVGSGFKYQADLTIVHFGGVQLTQADGLVVVDSTKIQVKVPLVAIAAPVTVEVETPLGTSSDAVVFTYVDGIPIEFSKTRIASIESPTRVAFAPNGCLYVSNDKGMLYKLTLGDDNQVTHTVKSMAIAELSGNRMILGIAFDPMDTSDNPDVYVSHSEPFHGYRLNSSGPGVNGKVSKLSGADLSIVKDIITGLPVSDRKYKQ